MEKDFKEISDVQEYFNKVVNIYKETFDGDDMSLEG